MEKTHSGAHRGMSMIREPRVHSYQIVLASKLSKCKKPSRWDQGKFVPLHMAPSGFSQRQLHGCLGAPGVIRL